MLAASLLTLPFYHHATSPQNCYSTELQNKPFVSSDATDKLTSLYL